MDYGQVYIITGRRLLVNKTSIFAMYKVKKPNEKKVMFIFSTLYRVHKSGWHNEFTWVQTCLLSEVYCCRLCYTTETMVQRIHRCKSVYIHSSLCIECCLAAAAVSCCCRRRPSEPSTKVIPGQHILVLSFP